MEQETETRDWTITSDTTWARWNSGHKQPVWHARKPGTLFPGRNGFTYCGHAIPSHAITFEGCVPLESVCLQCKRGRVF